VIRKVGLLRQGMQPAAMRVRIGAAVSAALQTLERVLCSQLSTRSALCTAQTRSCGMCALQLFECVVCDKLYKSEMALKNHESSKKHKEQLKKFKRLMKDEDDLNLGDLKV
jgi:Zinc-finger double-stranded RNA-binding